MLKAYVVMIEVKSTVTIALSKGETRPRVGVGVVVEMERMP